MRVLHVSEANEWTGGTAQLLALAAGLSRRGWACAVACRPGSGLSRHAADAGLEAPGVALREDYDLLSAWRLARLIESTRVDVVHAHHNRSHAVALLSMALLALRGRKPVFVVSRRVSFPPGRNPFSRWKYRSSLIDSIVAVADAVRDVLLQAGVPPERVRVIRSGVDTARFSPRRAGAEERKALGLPERGPVVGKIANASPWKGQNVLLAALAKLRAQGREVHALFAGRDTQGEWLRGEARRLGVLDHVTLAGFRSDVPDLLACLDVSVNAAIAGEGLSGALRESLTMGVPVIASDVAGNRELLKGGAGGCLFKAGDADALAERLAWTLDHLDEARASVQAWRSQALEGFSLDKTISDTDALYRELLERRT